MSLNNLKIAFRSLLRRRTFTTINIAGLGLGMTAAIFAFLWAQNEFSFNRYHEIADKLYRINADLQVSDDETWYWDNTPLPLVEAMKNEVPEVLRTASMYQNRWKPFTLKKNATVLSSKQYAYVSEDWFNLFDHLVISGSAVGFQDRLQSAILTRGYAEKLFGRWDVAGEIFQLDSMQFAVQAVVENHPPNSGFIYEMMLPLSYYLSNPANRENENWGNFNFITFVELRPGTDLAALNGKLTALALSHRDRDNLKLSLQPLAEVYFDEERGIGNMLTGDSQTAYTFGLIGLIILFLACVNYVSITTAQAGMRTKEVGVRKIIGAAGPQIFRLLFAESILTTVFSLVLALCLVQLTMPFFNQFTEKNFHLDPTNPAVWIVAGGTMLAALLLSGVYPALFLTGFSPGSFLRGQSFLKMKNTAFRKGLVVVQFAITVGLIIGAMVIYQQQDFIRKKDLGYDRSQVFEFQVPYNQQRKVTVKAIKHSLLATPSVAGAVATNSSIIDVQSTHSGSIDWEGKPEGFVPTVSQLSAETGFGEMMGLELVEGRWFKPDSEADTKNVLLNEAAVRHFQMPGPVVGQKFHFHGNEGQVIGIVKDFHFQSLRQKIEPMVLYNYPPSNGNILVKTTEGRVAEALAAAEDAWAKHQPGQPFEYHFLDDTFERMYLNEQKNASLFRILAGLAVFISCLGLFGLAVFSTQQRTKEIGVQKVLGASVAGLIGLLSKDFLKLVAVALVIAAPLAYYFMNKWLADFAYRIDIQWWVFVVAGLMAVGVAFLTVGFQCAKAALANPVESLRSE